MVYLDTSFIAPLVIAEDSSDAVEAYVLKLKPGEMTTSLWTQVELASLVSRKLRMGEFSGAEADAVRGEFDRVLSESFELLLLTAPDFATAAKYLETPGTGLRAGDALYLAIAVRQILTLDMGLIDAGRQMTLPVTRGIG